MFDSYEKLSNSNLTVAIFVYEITHEQSLLHVQERDRIFGMHQLIYNGRIFGSLYFYLEVFINRCNSL